MKITIVFSSFLVCAPDKIDVAKSVKKNDHSIEITIFVYNVQNMNF